MKKSYELPRKTTHLLSLFVPWCASRNLLATQTLILFFILFYAYSEWRKIKGQKFFAHSFIAKMHRDGEKNNFAKAPLLLAIGALLCITFFHPTAYWIGIYQAGFCDTVAAICGKKWGKTKIPFFNRKTYVGSFCFLLAALPVSFYYLPPAQALMIAVIGAFLESLPFKDWDNLTVPFVVGFLVEQFLG